MSKLPKAAQDNRANQLNPNNPAYHSSRIAPDAGRANTTAAPRDAQQPKHPEPQRQEGKKP